MKPKNLLESDIAFLKRHETHFLTNQELTTRFLSLMREYPNYKRTDFSGAFGKTLNYLFDKETGNRKDWQTNIKDGGPND